MKRLFTNRKDCYYTPHWCIEDLLNSKFFHPPNCSFIFEDPCAGDFRIVDALIKRQFLAIGNEPRRGGKDFLTEWNNPIDCIISNPPYGGAIEFVWKGLNLAKTSCWLLRLSFLASQNRKKLFDEYPLSALYVLSKRPSFDNKGTDNSEYAWFIWDTQNIFEKGIHHL